MQIIIIRRLAASCLRSKNSEYAWQQQQPDWTTAGLNQAALNQKTPE